MGVTHFLLSPPFFIITMFFFFFLFPTPCNSHSFEAKNKFTLSGDAHFTNDAISLTEEYNHLQAPPPTPSSSSLAKGLGRALYKHPIRFLDRATNKTASFLCRFSFSITASPAYPCGDGLAFLMTSNATSLNNASGSGYFGLPIREQGSKESFFAIEFDTSFDPDLGDINDNHIGVDFDTVVSFASVAVDRMGINLKNGGLITAWIQYEEDTTMLNVWVSNSQVKPREPVISTKIDLLKTELKEFMYVGFSASNRHWGFSRHVIQSWQFKSSGLVSPDIGHNGCSLCFQTHEAFTVHGAFLHSQPNEKSGKVNKAAAVLVGGAALIIFTVVLFLDWRRIFCLGPRKFSVDQITKVTKNFRKSIGKGGAAEVFEGSLDLGQKVAVKLYRQGDTSVDSFQREKRAMEASLTHRNIVTCIGWCHQGNFRALVFEFMAKGSLARVLHGTNTHEPEFLSWSCRLKIVRGVASALTYLHRQERLQLLHRDITSPNVLLTKNFKAKLADFGIAEFHPRGESSNAGRSSIPSGTPGYISKDLNLTNIPTVKTDVYCFGVLALEVATGLGPIGKQQPLRDRVWQHSGELVELADKRLNGAFNEVEMKKMITVGMLCTQDNPKARPTMAVVKTILKKGETCPDKPVPVPGSPPAHPPPPVNPALLASITE